MTRILILALVLASCTEPPDEPAPSHVPDVAECIPDAGADSPNPMPPPEPTATSPQQFP